MQNTPFFIKFFLIILILTLSACVSFKNPSLNDPNEMINYQTNNINRYCNKLFSRDNQLKDKCKKRKINFRNHYGVASQGNGGFGDIWANELHESYADRSMYYFYKRNYNEAVDDCSYANHLFKSIYGGDYFQHKDLGLKALYWCGRAYAEAGDYKRAITYFESQKKLLFNMGRDSRKSKTCKELYFNDFYGSSKVWWENCNLIEKNLKTSRKILKTQIAKYYYDKRKQEAYEEEQQRIANEKYYAEIEKREKENLRKRKVQQAQQQKIQQDKINRWKAHIEKERLVCPQSKSLKISNILWESISTQFGLNPNYKKYRIVESSWIYGKEDKKIEPFWELLSEPDKLRCVLKIYIDTGVCNVSVEIVKNNNAGFFNILKGRYEFHNSNSSPCIK